jgi:hypothetical protein
VVVWKIINTDNQTKPIIHSVGRIPHYWMLYHVVHIITIVLQSVRFHTFSTSEGIQPPCDLDRPHIVANSVRDSCYVFVQLLETEQGQTDFMTSPLSLPITRRMNEVCGFPINMAQLQHTSRILPIGLYRKAELTPCPLRCSTPPCFLSGSGWTTFPTSAPPNTGRPAKFSKHYVTCFITLFIYYHYPKGEVSQQCHLGYGLHDWLIGVRFQAKVKYFLSTRASRPALGPIQTLIQWIPSTKTYGKWYNSSMDS